MKKLHHLPGIFLVVTILLLLNISKVHAAPLNGVPVTVIQPDGAQVHIFVSGDEYYNWLHDAAGYTIIQDPVSGFYVYADLINNTLIPTQLVAGRADPSAGGLRPNLNITPEQKTNIRQSFMEQTIKEAGVTSYAPNSGTVNNMVIFIHFSDEPEFTDFLSLYNGMLNDPASGANSLLNYYQEVSYGALTINSFLLPISGTDTIVSYQDGRPRGYYQPYNAVTNPDGYTGGDSGTERRLREHTLLKDALGFVESLGDFPSASELDANNDGVIDGLTFVVSGSPTGWSSLLWPHQWSLYSFNVTVNGKKADGYSLHLNSTLNTGVLAHEMFHSLGAPDLYHYSNDGLQPVGAWDVMEGETNPPQHMSCYMKYKYGGWISGIPQISTPGPYSLNPLTSSTSNCYQIPSPYSLDEYFVVEYRNGTGSTFESSLPGNGMLVYRINTRTIGNAYGPPNEIYLYRPDGTPNANGDINSANFSNSVGRDSINDTTNPSSFLTNGGPGGLALCNIGNANTSISFDICPGALLSISGNTGAGGVILNYVDGSPKTAISDVNGDYILPVSSGWSGMVTTSKYGYTFIPPMTTYASLFTSLTMQNYSVASAPANLLQDPGFEAYTPNPYWAETSTNFGTPLCSVADCGISATAAPQRGSSWASLGGITSNETSSISQTVIIPAGAARLEFYLWIGKADAGSDAADIFTAKIDGAPVFSANATQKNSYLSYTLVSMDVSSFANGGSHTISFGATTTGQNVTFNLDDVALLSSPNKIPNPLTPKGVVQDNTPTFRWTRVPGATKYRFQVARGGTLIYTNTVSSNICSATTCVTTPATVLGDFNLKWRVQANVNGVWKNYSTYKSFTVISPFYSTFTSDSTGWSALNGNWNIANGFYTAAGSPSQAVTSAYKNNYSSLIFQVRMKRTGSCATCVNSLYFRGIPEPQTSNKNWDTGFRFSYNNQKLWQFLYIDHGVFQPIIDFTPSNAIVVNGWNTLTVAANGKSIQLFINNVLVYAGSHPGLNLNGKVGLGFFSYNNTDRLYVDWAKLDFPSPTFSYSNNVGKSPISTVNVGNNP